MKIKNKQILPILEGIKKVEHLKLGGIKTKILLNNKKTLLAAFEELEEVREKLIDQYKEPGEEIIFSNTNRELIEAEWRLVNEQESGVELLKMNSAELDQFNDLTLEQMEVLDLMSE